MTDVRNFPRNFLGFLKTDNWVHFIEKWKNVIFEDEAFGMLRVAAEIDRSGIINTKVNKFKIDFFLQYAQCGNKYVEHRAQQILFSNVLLSRFDYADLDTAYLHKKILTFLSDRHEGLLHAPFPNYILEYLYRFQGIWKPYKEVAAGECPHRERHDGNAIKRCLKVQEKIQSYTPLFVTAMVQWGWGHKIDVAWQTDIIEEVLKNYLIKHNWSVKNAHLRIPQLTYGDPKKASLNYDPMNVQQIANASAYYALLEIQNVVKQKPIIIGGEKP